MFIIIFIISLLGLFNISSARFVQDGQCDPNIPLAGNFNLDQFLATWYEIGRTENAVQDFADCSHLELVRDTETDTLTFYNRAYNRNFLVERSGTAEIDGTARLTLNLNDGSDVIPIDFWILVTDHLNFAVAYGCENISPTQRSVNVWHLQRSTAPISELMIALINVTLSNLLDITVEDLNSLDHSDDACYELPLIEPGQPIVLPGLCDPDITVVQDFDVDAFTGEWHEQSSYFSESVRGTCPRTHYSLQGGTINVVNSYVIGQALDTVSGTATIISTDNSARLLVELEVEPGVIEQQELYIIATDYSNYAISYTCENIDSNSKRVFSWILGRSRQLSDMAAAEVDQVVNSVIDLNFAYYVETPRSDDDCFYFPEPVTGQPVVFRGQCDLNSISAMQDFNVELYMGLWHDIESYPSEFQGGTCNNAQYALNDGVVDVYNTQVIDQALDTIRGNATLASDDGSGKLIVTFPIPGTDLTVEADYWVLDTDYTSYALVYTCENIDEDNRLVWSWKLSRTKQLSEAAHSAINSVISTIPILDQRYYEDRDQSVEGCFYFPEPQEGVPVIFPGQCDDSIVAVENFNLDLFQGTWFEIETYPKDFHPGQCISHQYTSGAGSTLNLESNSVVDQLLQLYPSTLTLVSTDGSGRLLMTLSDGETVPFWVLSTDYTDFAFAYSCENINSDFRAIHSWKLSRNRLSLSPAANTAINDIVSNIQVLDNVYFEPIDQSHNACFFFPDLALGEPVILPGQCDPDSEVFQNLDTARYEGLWHLIESYPSDFQEGTCNDATYTMQEDGIIVVYNTQVIDQSLDTVTGSATLWTDNSARLTVTFPGALEPIEYWIVDTDYDSYSVSYRCENVNSDQRRVWSWKMSRTRSLTPEATETINDIVDRVLVLNNRYFEVINNSDDACFYYPIPDGNPVTFRGQCDSNIQAFPNFNTANYMGLWHDIESYPSVFQGGTCNNAFYTLNGDVVNVLNTQVIGQSLDSINGEAVVVSDDGSARLVVTFPIAGTDLTVNSDYWVLATDYTSYALVYTCENIDDYYRRVWSWKLSRAKQLSADAATAINNVVNTVDVLDQRYYEAKDQSEEGCFYFPDPEEGVPVVFPGQCDESIAVVNDFDLEQFSGTWHEIETYPRYFQTGHCINHEYVEGEGNTLILQSFSVDEEALQLSNSTLAFTSTDNSARLIITLDDGITIPFWILSTDYTDYALAYSCENSNSDFRSIYSWKLSRSRTLSPNADTSINSVISNIQVLDNVYYEAVDQTDDACFFLPDLTPGEPVVFPGQCDQNIPVVQNFDAERYAGLWHLIQSYASEFQGGTCNDATYTVQEDGTILVFNTQVIDQTLDTVTVSATLIETDELSAKFLVTFPTALDPVEYWILDTDYDSYALAYSCVNLNSDQRQVWSWKMSRTKSLTPVATEAIDGVVSNINVLNDRFYEDIDNSDNACFYYPVPDGHPVTFRGQCDLNIAAVANFNAVSYMGLWHDIESYPSVFQSGTCNNAFYALNGDIDVLNTQVIDQSLDSINGEAVVASDDGSARLVVTFPIVGTDQTVDSNYWVLATDYSSYALVYTCENINDDHRQVWSWKLSRNKELTADAATAINNAISPIPVLDQRYYELSDQTEEGCFFFPEPEEGVPVVFPGQCDESITVINDFNLDEFQGIWHEIETYPNDFQQGQCISHEHSEEADNTLRLQSSSVDGQALQISNSTLSFTSSDNSARLLITLENGITIPFWILSTDYTDYALAYSCENINSDFRAIYSWKLSRSRSLSANANTAINSAIANVQVLDNVYYEAVDQSDDACFYFPVLLPDEPVVFPGQCDLNIAVMQNFDAALFAGRWFDIESYFDDYEGTCIDGTLSQNENGYDIIATLVSNEALETSTNQGTLAVDGSGILTINTPDGPLEYWILDTDYETYSLIYSCTNLNTERRRVRSWKLSRTRELSVDSNTAINAITDGINVLNEQYYNVKDHSDAACFYYPVPVLGQPVRFRGQCDETIAAVSDFDLERYMGIWFDIESYPQIFQDGTCATATYTAGDGIVEVYNTQVVNQRLDEIHGSAVLDSDDGSGKLLVSFPIAGTDLTSPYWILATDYDSFSLVYSCRNIDDEYRSVSFWKLSREQSLTSEAETAIAGVMENVPVLRQQYFEETGHTFDDCLYYPDNFGGPIIRNDGHCPDDSEVEVVSDFSAAAFAGTWHEISRFPSELQNGECASSQLLSTGGNAFTMTQSIVYNERLNSISGPAEVSSDGRGIITATLNGGEAIKLYILDTDYSEYALAYSCRNLDNDRRQIYSWKLSRSRTGLSQEANDIIDYIVFRKLELFGDYYDTTDQGNEGCFHYPEFDPLPDVITLPGPCDERIQGKDNFDTEAYLGRWFEISKYPQPAQVGTCSRIEYDSETFSNDILVFNSLVLDRTLEHIMGLAEMSSNDGSGVFETTFYIDGETDPINYYVLETDYTSFALVYTCRNLNDGNRQVSSWKLSRTRTLSDEANLIINSVIDSTQGLLEDYYTITSQSDEDCFYVPGLDESRAPEFRGACEDITGVDNFNIQAYQGWWHEIERYPASEDIGECISSQFEQNGNQLRVVDTNVVGEIGHVSSSTLTATADGRLRRTYDDGRVVDSWVLATDYETYSLLYSCETFLNQHNDEYRRVWSAKHSKSRQLTEAAQNSITSAMENYELLYPQFYLPVDQSDSACFHYPVLSGDTVILPGQCDASIPVVQNFDLGEYTGTWYQIERYPHRSVNDDSTCVGISYTLDEETQTLVITSVEVVDGDLVTQEGTATLAADGSGRLTISMLSDDEDDDTITTSELYVLSVDYAVHSLLYYCENVNQFQREITAFKFSRTRTMPASGTAAINAVIAQRQELHQPYFLQVEQDEECPEPASGVLVNSNSWVLATDYETYSLLYSCETFLNQHNDEYRRVWSAKHSKSRQLTEAAQNSITSAMENYELLYPQFYLPVDQSDSACFHYPVLSGDTVILPGQCDASIPVVQNFDLGEYTGTWYQIERYPHRSVNDDSTCVGISYTLDEETQTLVITSVEVVDGDLVTQEGTATLAADGSGRLTISMLSDDEDDDTITTSELYVLSVDYAVHSLLYYCENVNQFQREITAFKFSRTRTMPASGTAAINAVIAQRQELHQPYFLQVEQDEECPEPASGVLVNSSIIVILVCGVLQLLL